MVESTGNEYTGFFLKTLLQVVGCKNIAFEDVTINSTNCCVVGFTALPESLKLISAVLPVGAIYSDEADNHVLIPSWRGVSDILFKLFNQTLLSIPKLPYSSMWQNYSTPQRILTKELYDRLRLNESTEQRNALFEKGLGLRTDSKRLFPIVLLCGMAFIPQSKCNNIL